jgi:hypothetical protein
MKIRLGDLNKLVGRSDDAHCREMVQETFQSLAREQKSLDGGETSQAVV